MKKKFLALFTALSCLALAQLYAQDAAAKTETATCKKELKCADQRATCPKAAEEKATCKAACLKTADEKAACKAACPKTADEKKACKAACPKTAEEKAACNKAAEKGTCKAAK
ncbi:MAG: hypothetical protein WCT05_10645 [Lentisphaeria bacterium]